ncbi:MAG: hypothetical protein ACXWWQ_08930 [Candidatus Limnocylindria bacterium]
MDTSGPANVPQLGAPLDPIRAAISLVADGHARRVTVHTPAARQLMPAARQLARASGVTAQLVVPADSASDLVVLRLAQESA